MPDRSWMHADPDPAWAERLEQRLVSRLLRGEASEPEAVNRASASPITEPELIDLEGEPLNTVIERRRPNPARFVVLVLAVAAVVLAGLVVIRHADKASPAAGRAVTFTITWPDLGPLGVADCPPGEKGTYLRLGSGCLRRWTGEVALGGDAAGNAVFILVGADAGTAPVGFTATYHVAATVAGCGTGEFSMVETMTFTDDHGWQGDWRIIDGTGFGDLAKISGSGKVPGDTPKSNAEDRTGRISC